MANIAVILVLVVIIGGAVLYIYKAKKNGAKCIGCPAGKTCGKQGESSCCGSCASCGGCSHRK